MCAPGRKWAVSALFDRQTATGQVRPMCNLYSVTTNQEAIRRLFAVADDRAGNLPPLAAVFPDQMAPIVRAGPGGGRELVLARWGGPARRRPERRW